MDEDYYKVLGIKRDASQKEIQRAYRDLARKYHPDMNPGDQRAKENFQRIQQAYDVLNDAEKREMYDRYGSSFESIGAGGRGPRHGYQRGAPGGGGEEFDFSQLFGGRGSEGFADIFRQFTGGRGAAQPPPPRRGTDVQHQLEIPFNTAVTGGEAAVTLRRPGGKVETISVKIPPGIEDGKKIRLRGQGEAAGRDGTRGDLMILIRVAAHPCFTRRGNHLEVNVPITLGEAVSGGKIDVPTPKGTITLTVPPGTSSGRRLRVKGHGVAPPKGAPGDLFAVVQIVLPPDIDDQTAQQIQELDQQYPVNPRAELKW